jgi:hypothetical protein
MRREATRRVFCKSTLTKKSPNPLGLQAGEDVKMEVVNGQWWLLRF